MSNYLAPLVVSPTLFVELRVLMTGEDRVSVRVEGPTAESIVLAFTTLAGDRDETASAICGVLLRERNLVGCSELDDAIDRYLGVDFDPPLVGHVPVEVASINAMETATMTVTTTSLGALVGAMFVHFAGAIDRVRDVLVHGVNADGSGGVELSTNIRREP